MKRANSILFMAVALAFCWALPVAAPAQTDDEIKLMEAAMPAAPGAPAATSPKMLVFTLCKGYVHGSIPYCAKSFEIMGKKTGVFEAVVSDDPAVFAPDSLKRFAVVCFDNSTGELFTDEALKKSLMDFIKNGGGVVGVHAATDAFNNWAEFGEMMGGFFDGHPWGSNQTVRVKLDEPGHPLCAAFKGSGFSIKDEIYQFKDPYSRAKLRVLLSIDVEQTDMKRDTINRTDGDFAISWIHEFGKGRVFYCSLGHNNEIFWNPLVLQYYLDGIRYALGEVKADATPSAQLQQADLDKSQLDGLRASLDKVLKQIATYKFGESRAPLSDLDNLVAASGNVPEFRKEVAAKLAGLLGSDATPDCKQHVCRQLYIIGTAKEVPAIAALLDKPETSDMARYALERMPDPAADKALVSALGDTGGLVQVGVINSLGERRTENAVSKLAKLTSNKDAAVAKAAMAALGKIGNADAAKALAQAKKEAGADFLSAVGDAYLMCADRMLAEGNKEEAAAIYEEMFQVIDPKPLKLAAFEGLVAVKGADAASIVLDALASSDAAMQAVGAGAARTAPEATAALAAGLEKLAPHGQALLLGALADRGDKAALAAATKAASSGDAEVRVAATRALGALGDTGSVALLVKVATGAQKDEAGAAASSLDRLRGADVDGTMVATLRGADAAVRKELIRSLAARSAVTAVPVLLEQAKDADESIRVEALKGLGVLGTAKDLPALIDLLVAAKGAGERTESENAVAAVARKAAEGADRTGLVLAALDKAKDVAVDASLVRILGALGDATGLDAVRAAASSKNKDIEDAGVRALVDWPDAGPMADVQKLAKESKDETHQVLAVRGLIRMIGLRSERKPAETLDLYVDAMKLTNRPDEQRRAIAGMATVPDDRVPGILQSYLTNDALKEEAQKALERYQNETSKKK